uniref:Uncharacterized protein n=1 Tax=Setaria viridis TaxID=4556 RepID=A0A4U6W3G1_SETVI|nr:hypothetical protein SEVIR_2G404650v2 [Setaria viridis]
MGVIVLLTIHSFMLLLFSMHFMSICTHSIISNVCSHFIHFRERLAGERDRGARS